MPRYLIERRFGDGLHIPTTAAGAELCNSVIDRNTDLAVTWLHSYVSEDKSTTYCIYDGLNAETIRKAAERNGLPIERITKVTVLDPFFYH
jgi:hypothetical protein